MLYGTERLRAALDAQRDELAVLMERARCAEREARAARAEAAGARRAAERAAAAAAAGPVGGWEGGWVAGGRAGAARDRAALAPAPLSPTRVSAGSGGSRLSTSSATELTVRTALLYPRAAAARGATGSPAGSGSRAHTGSLDAMDALLSERTAAAFWGVA
jgi:regulator of protease activity HflC (stomatin/prohibitin superfamily)